MKKHDVLWAVLFVAVLAAVALVAFWSRGQTYEGKTLGYWIAQLPSIELGTDGSYQGQIWPGTYFSAAEVDADQARVKELIRQAHKALETIGTNHLSMLVARLKQKDTKLKITMWEWAERLRIADFLGYQSAQWRRGQALRAFEYLRSRAQPVVPQLIELTTNQDNQIRMAAWNALARVTPEDFRKMKHPPMVQSLP